MSLKKNEELRKLQCKGSGKKIKKKSIDLLLASKFIWEQALIKVDVND